MSSTILDRRIASKEATIDLRHARKRRCGLLYRLMAVFLAEMQEVVGAIAHVVDVGRRCELRIRTAELRGKVVVHRIVAVGWCGIRG